MNPQGTSFIPKRPTFGQSPKKIVRKVYVFTYLVYIFFFGTLLSVFGVMAYDYMLDSQLQAEKDKLVTEEARFSDSDIESVKKFDSQLQITTERMDAHLSVLPIFEGLERSVSQLISLKTFIYTREGDSAPKMKITGESSVLNSLAFQRDVLKNEPLFSGAEYEQVTVTSALPKDKTSEVITIDELETTIPFSLSKTLDISLLRYKPNVASETATEAVIQADGETEETQEQVTEQTTN
ncbi:MAG: hypothetical protein RLZZ76_763 [Candidatus Parcubacteria bacterium]|jgi:hypothetical protein